MLTDDELKQIMQQFMSYEIPPPYIPEVESEPVGTFDFLTTPQELFPYIYDAYNHYGDAPIRVKNQCKCIVCTTARYEPVDGRNEDGTVIDDGVTGTNIPPTTLGA